MVYVLTIVFNATMFQLSDICVFIIRVVCFLGGLEYPEKTTEFLRVADAPYGMRLYRVQLTTNKSQTG